MASLQKMLISSSFFIEPSSYLLCKNNMNVEHFAFSVTGHAVLQLYRIARERFFAKSEESNWTYFLLGHYVLLWSSVLTSPRSLQLDFWLLIVAMMDILPLLLGLYKAAVVLSHNQNDEDLSFHEISAMTVSAEMRQWSPAYLINERIMFAFNGCLFSHMYLLFWFVIIVTQMHNVVVKMLYCNSFPF